MSSEKERRFRKEEFYGWRCQKNTLDKYLDSCKESVMNNERFKIFEKALSSDHSMVRTCFLNGTMTQAMKATIQ